MVNIGMFLLFLFLFALFISFASVCLLCQLGAAFKLIHESQLCNFHVRQSHIKQFPDYPSHVGPLRHHLCHSYLTTLGTLSALQEKVEEQKKCTKIATSCARKLHEAVQKRADLWAGGNVQHNLKLAIAKSTIATFSHSSHNR